MFRFFFSILPSSLLSKFLSQCLSLILLLLHFVLECCCGMFETIANGKIQILSLLHHIPYHHKNIFFFLILRTLLCCILAFVLSIEEKTLCFTEKCCNYWQTKNVVLDIFRTLCFFFSVTSFATKSKRK